MTISTLNKEKKSVLEQVRQIYDFFSSKEEFCKLIPEVRTNISMSIPEAKSKKDIAAIEGRITIIEGYPKACGDIKFGVSNHTARLLLKTKEFDNSINIVMNIKYTPELIEKIKNSSDLEIKEINRQQQSQNIRNEENSTMQWLIKECVNEIGRIPDIIWDKGAIGKEPMIRLFGKQSEDILYLLKILLNFIK